MQNGKNHIIKILSAFSLILILFSQVIQTKSLNNITLLDGEVFHEETLNNFESELFYVNGSMSENKKYLLISSITETTEDNSFQSKSPLLYISKNKNDLLYDYTSISQSTNFGNKIALPYSYLGKDGFYLNITCETVCEKNLLKFETLDEINLELGEKFSFFSKIGEINNFIININLTNYEIDDNITNIVFLISGGESKQLSMKINEINAKKFFGDIYFISMKY